MAQLDSEMVVRISTSPSTDATVAFYAVDGGKGIRPFPQAELHLVTGAGLTSVVTAMDAEGWSILGKFCRDVAKELKRPLAGDEAGR